MLDEGRKPRQPVSSEPDFVFNWNNGTWTPRAAIEKMRQLEREIIYGVKDGNV